MCLWTSEYKTEELKETFKLTPYITCYKIVYSDPNEKHYRSVICTHFKWKKGWNRSNISLLDEIALFFHCYKPSYHIDNGIHVFINEKAAENELELLYPNKYTYKIITVKCYKKDFMAVGEDNDAVFSKVWLEENKDYGNQQDY